eukprot:COSAG01_NODE_210_length_21939_cov_32.062096_12_plen_697_part_00
MSDPKSPGHRPTGPPAQHLSPLDKGVATGDADEEETSRSGSRSSRRLRRLPPIDEEAEKDGSSDAEAAASTSSALTDRAAIQSPLPRDDDEDGFGESDGGVGAPAPRSKGKKRARTAATTPYEMPAEVAALLKLEGDPISSKTCLTASEARAECTRRKGTGDARLRVKNFILGLGVWGGSKGTAATMAHRLKIADVGIAADIEAMNVTRSVQDSLHDPTEDDYTNLLVTVCGYDVRKREGAPNGDEISLSVTNIDSAAKGVTHERGWHQLEKAATLGVELLAIADQLEPTKSLRRGNWLRDTLHAKVAQHKLCVSTAVVTNVLDAVISVAKAHGGKFYFGDFIEALPFVKPEEAATTGSASAASSKEPTTITPTEHEACRIAHVMADEGMAMAIGTIYHGRTLAQLDDKVQREAAEKKLTEFYNNPDNKFSHPAGTTGVNASEYAAIDTAKFRQINVSQFKAAWAKVASAHTIFEKRWLSLSGHRNPHTRVISEANEVANKVWCKPVVCCYLHALFFKDGLPTSALWEQLSRSVPDSAGIESQSGGPIHCTKNDSRVTEQCMCPRCVATRRRSSGNADLNSIGPAIQACAAALTASSAGAEMQAYYATETESTRSASRLAVGEKLLQAKKALRAAIAAQDTEAREDTQAYIDMLQEEAQQFAPKRQRLAQPPPGDVLPQVSHPTSGAASGEFSGFN